MTGSYGADETSVELATGLREFFNEHCGLDRVRAAWSDGSLDLALWGEVAALGFTGALASEEVGGLGVQPEDLVLAIEEIGYSGASLPLVDTAAVVVPIIERYGSAEQRASFLPGLISGERIAASTVMFGGDRAMFAAEADVLLLERDDCLHLLDRRQFSTVEVHSPDPASRLARVSVESSVLSDATRLAAGATDDARGRAVWAASALLNGVSRRMLEMTVDHAKTREQFGRAIGSFQAVKHLIADAWVAMESSRPCAWYAAHACSQGLADAAAAASVAKASASDAARVVGDSALQVHGGIGFTWEHPLHFWMKRGKLLEHAYGSRGFHLRSLGAAMRDDQQGSDAVFPGL
ncbi:acyl-CoA dehydrogenase family protein [Ruicaihuangia caeni]|uniref:Acyl-CoA dehydrogenase family protein n=1 Tax=Ruicaihuangia caeni TaxID=3042517 RepID=A0AAW6T5G9_9MICO|nr:acyl-CoA dehydrogenase family protein [Klugiella sp. YN-L-19]MDI2098699.1 acyl-CoA dehydrogenase family protein [Klugiella sp. YN-L-19]